MRRKRVLMTEKQYRDFKRFLQEKEKVEYEVRYYPDGTIKSKIPFVDGVEHGIGKFYYSNGLLNQEVPFVKGKIHGIEKTYDKNKGKLIRETPYVYDVVDGIEKRYYLNGQVERETPFVDNKEHGIEKYYDLQGEVMDTLEWKHGDTLPRW